MVVVSQPLGPGKFYGSSLPRPYIYTDVKNSSERVDPPAPFTDPFLSWAREAHWTMGGLSFNRLRLQGRIEGSVKRLCAQHEKQNEGRTPIVVSLQEPPQLSPEAPIAVKSRKRFTVLIDDDEEEEEVGEKVCGGRKRLARRLGDEFDRVADKSLVKAEAMIKTRRLRKIGESETKKVVESGSSYSHAGIRVSPRLAKRG